jgi:hypothetical protein
MNDKNLMRALRAADAREVEKAPKQHRLRTPRCPPLTRFSTAVREGWTPDERKHVTACAYCQRIIEMEHRLSREENGEEPALLTFPIRLRRREVAADKTGPLTTEDVPAGQGLEWRLAVDDGRTLFRIRTRETALAGQLVRYELCGPAGTAPLVGFVALKQDANAWYIGRVHFNAEDLYSRLQGECHGVLVRPADAAQLTDADREALRASAERSEDEEERQRLGEWLKRSRL